MRNRGEAWDRLTRWCERLTAQHTGSVAHVGSVLRGGRGREKGRLSLLWDAKGSGDNKVVTRLQYDAVAIAR